MPEQGNHPEEPSIAPVIFIHDYKARRAVKIEDAISGSNPRNPNSSRVWANNYRTVTGKIIKKAGFVPPEGHIAPVVDIYGLE